MFGLKLGLPRRSSSKTSPPETPTTTGPALSPIASAVVLAAGAGVAFWWWTQWARGRAESEAEIAAADPPQGDAEAATDLD
jgi:uncharacterized protein HemX